MKKTSLLLVFCLAILTVAQAQIPPQAFNYSAVARNAAGQPITTATIGIQISILKTSALGTVMYSENHFVNTDSFGLFNLIVGAGAVQSGSMNSIQWSTDNFYLKVGMDINGGTNFLTMGTTQLLSVPYAIHAATADSIAGVAVDGSETVIIAGSDVTITGSGTTADPYIVNAAPTAGSIPVVSTGNVIEILNAYSGSGMDFYMKVPHLVSSDGGETILSRGICYGPSPNPTTSGSGTPNSFLYWTGSDTSQIFNLQPNTTFYIRAFAVNAKGTAYGNQVSFTTTNVQQATLVTDPVSNFTFNPDGNVNAEFNGQLTNDGGQSPMVCFCYATSPNPTINDYVNFVGYGPNFASLGGNLMPNTTYYVRTYATNSAGTAYGNQVIFTTPQVQLATVETYPVTDINGAPGPSFNALFNGALTDNGGTPYTNWGFCYSTSPNPTTADILVEAYPFSGYVNNLQPGLTFYVRAYATNAAGTAYGNEVSFSTPTELPEVITQQVSNITNTSADITGELIYQGYCLGEFGFYLSTSPLPTSNDIILNYQGGSYPTFTLNPSEFGITLQSNTTYYVRSYGIACWGGNETVYGNELSFTTLP